MPSPLAIDLGPRVRTRPWPLWPKVTPRNEQLLLDALRSGRWAVSGAYTGQPSFERRFAATFAEFHDLPYCVPTCHGSSALAIALEGLGVGAGCEVLVPGLTWVACASAVTGVGAVPVLVDIDEETLCMSLSAAEAAITDRTAAILVVHLFGSAADVDGFVELSRRRRIPLIEDCSQCHGARWRGQRLGTFGDVAAFSFQQTKLLTSGEGGAVLTRDPALCDRLQQLRADGRRDVAAPVRGQLDVEEVGDVQGRNYGLSEFHAALLCEGLERLDAENAVRRRNVAQLTEMLTATPGITRQRQPSALAEPTYYHLCLRLDPALISGVSVDWFARALAAELDLPAIDPVDTPLNGNRLYNPLKSPRTAQADCAQLDPARFALPAAEAARRTCFTIPHNALLGDASDLRDIVDALAKVRAHALLTTGTTAGSARG